MKTTGLFLFNLPKQRLRRLNLTLWFTKLWLFTHLLMMTSPSSIDVSRGQALRRRHYGLPHGAIWCRSDAAHIKNGHLSPKSSPCSKVGPFGPKWHFLANDPFPSRNPGSANPQFNTLYVRFFALIILPSCMRF